MPSPRAVVFLFTSRAASSRSSRNHVLACPATFLTAAPMPPRSVSWVGMAPPVDDLGEDDARNESRADDDHRARTPGALRLRALAELRPRGGNRALARFLVRRRLAFRPLDDEARLQLPEECRVVGERLGELGAQAAFGGRAVGELLQARSGAVDNLVGFRQGH